MKDNMNKKAIKINKKDLKKQLETGKYIEKYKHQDVLYLDIYSLEKDYPQLNKDLKKIYFNRSNIEIEYDDSEFLGNESKCLIGFHTLKNGLSFLGCYAHGDCEIPIFFIIYKDDTTLRGYIPEHGNIYNKRFNCAFGSEREIEPQKNKFNEDDRKYLKQIFSNINNEQLNEVLDMDIDDTMGYLLEWGESLVFNWKEIRNDILNRFEIIE